MLITLIRLIQLTMVIGMIHYDFEQYNYNNDQNTMSHSNLFRQLLALIDDVTIKDVEGTEIISADLEDLNFEGAEAEPFISIQSDGLLHFSVCGTVYACKRGSKTTVQVKEVKSEEEGGGIFYDVVFTVPMVQQNGASVFRKSSGNIIIGATSQAQAKKITEKINQLVL